MKRAGTIIAIAGGLALGASTVAPNTHDQIEPTQNKKALQNISQETGVAKEAMNFMKSLKHSLCGHRFMI